MKIRTLGFTNPYSQFCSLCLRFAFAKLMVRIGKLSACFIKLRVWIDKLSACFIKLRVWIVKPGTRFPKMRVQTGKPKTRIVYGYPGLSISIFLYLGWPRGSVPYFYTVILLLCSYLAFDWTQHIFCIGKIILQENTNMYKPHFHKSWDTF